MWAPPRSLAGLVVLGRHRRQQPVEPRLAGELGMECRRQHVPLADRDHTTVIEACQDVDVGARPLDARAP